jgi:hypothetical protein
MCLQTECYSVPAGFDAGAAAVAAAGVAAAAPGGDV